MVAHLILIKWFSFGSNCNAAKKACILKTFATKSHNLIVKIYGMKKWRSNSNNSKKKLTWNLFCLLMAWLQKWYIAYHCAEQMIADYRTNDEKCFCLNCESTKKKNERWNANKIAKLVDFPVIWLTRNCLITGKVSFLHFFFLR